MLNAVLSFSMNFPMVWIVLKSNGVPSTDKNSPVGIKVSSTGVMVSASINNSIGLSSPYETFNIPTAEELNKPIETIEDAPVEEFQPKPPEEVVEAKSTVEKGNITSAVNAVRNATKNIEEADFKIETEEFDFEDLYQIIIKIEK